MLRRPVSRAFHSELLIFPDKLFSIVNLLALVERLTKGQGLDVSSKFWADVQARICRPSKHPVAALTTALVSSAMIRGLETGQVVSCTMYC